MSFKLFSNAKLAGYYHLSGRRQELKRSTLGEPLSKIPRRMSSMLDRIESDRIQSADKVRWDSGFEITIESDGRTLVISVNSN